MGRCQAGHRPPSAPSTAPHSQGPLLPAGTTAAPWQPHTDTATASLHHGAAAEAAEGCRSCRAGAGDAVHAINMPVVCSPRMESLHASVALPAPAPWGMAGLQSPTGPVPAPAELGHSLVPMGQEQLWRGAALFSLRAAAATQHHRARGRLLLSLVQGCCRITLFAMNKGGTSCASAGQS